MALVGAVIPDRAMLLGKPGLWFFYKHLRATRRIREMYCAEGVEGASREEEQKRQQVKKEHAGIGAAIGAGGDRRGRR